MRASQPSAKDLLAAIVFVALTAASGAAQETPALTVGGATAEGLIVSTTGVSFSRSVPIINTQNGPIDVSIDAAPLVGPDSASVAVKWDLNGRASLPATAKIPALGSVQLTMTTELPVVGTYQGTLSLIYGEKRHQVAIKITRTASQPGVIVTGLSAMAFGGGGTRAVDFSVRETAGARAVLHPPRVLSLTQKVGDKNLQVQISGVTFHMVGADGRETPVGQSVAVDRNASVPIVMRVPGAAAPGEYTGSLHIASPEGALAAVPFTFYVRRSWWVCAGLIALGVVLSHFLRNYAKSGRPRLILVRRFTMVDADIDAAMAGFADPDDRSLLSALKQRVRRAASDAEVGQTADVDATLKDIDAKLSLVPLWSTLRGRIAGLTNSNEGQAAKPVLEDGRRFLTAHHNDKSERINEEVQAIRGALAKIDTAIRARLTKDIAATRASAQAAAADLSPERQTAFQREVLNVLTAAEAAIAETPPDDNGARTMIDDARRAYARVAARELEERLDTVERPAVLAEADWNALLFAFRRHVENAGAAKTGNEAVREYDDAYAQYLAILVRVATESHDTVRARVPQGDTESHERLTKAAATLGRARTRLRERDFGPARASYEEAKTEIDAIAKKHPPARAMGQPGSQRSPDPVQTAVSPIGLGLSESVSLDTPAERGAREWASLADIHRSLRSRDRAVSWTTGGVAVLFGLYLIWMDNLTWGSPKDMAAAVFWGLGLHQIAGNTLFAKLDLEQFEHHLTGVKTERAAGATP